MIDDYMLVCLIDLFDDLMLCVMMVIHIICKMVQKQDKKKLTAVPPCLF